MSYSKEMFKEIILDHVKNPRNKGKKHDGYLEKTLKNPSCGDVVTIYLAKENNQINDLTYEVSGCSICSASVSMMSELLIDKTEEEAREVVKNFNKMIMEQPYEEKLLGDAISLQSVSTIPARIKCATLGYKVLTELMNNGGDNNGNRNL